MTNITLLPLGHIVGFRGLRGEFRVRLENPAEDWYADLKRVYLQPNPKARVTQYTVSSATPAGGSLLLILKAFPSRTEAEPLLGSQISIAQQDVPPRKANEYTLEELTGLTLLDPESGETLGTIKSVLFSGTQVFLDLVFTHPKPAELTVPFQSHFFPSVDLNERTIRVKGLNGLL